MNAMTHDSKLLIKALSKLAEDDETVFEILPKTLENRKTGRLIHVDLDDSKQYAFPKFEKCIMSLTDYLAKLGYIIFKDENRTVFTLTYDAIHFREIDFRNKCHALFHHFLCPVAVSVFSSVITTHIVLALKGLL